MYWKNNHKVYILLLTLAFVVIIELFFRFTVFNGHAPNYKGGSIYSEIHETLKSQSYRPFFGQPYLGYSNSPGLCDSENKSQVNNLGLRRNTETPIEKPVDTYRILFLGGPSTWTMMDVVRKTFPALIEKSLNEKEDGSNLKYTKFECLNAGLRGATSAEFITHYVFKFQYIHPDLIVIHSCFNDAVNYLCRSYNVQYQPDYHTTRRFFQEYPPLSQWLRFMLKSKTLSYVIIRVLYADYLNSVPEGNPFYKFKNENLWFTYGNDSMFVNHYNAFYNNLKSLIILAQANHQKILLVPDVYQESRYDTMFGANNKNMMVEGLHMNYAFIKKLSLEMNVPVCELDLKYFPPEMFLPGEDRYVNERGEAMKAQLIEQSIVEVLKAD